MKQSILVDRTRSSRFSPVSRSHRLSAQAHPAEPIPDGATSIHHIKSDLSVTPANESPCGCRGPDVVGADAV